MASKHQLLTVGEIARGGLGFVELALLQKNRFERVCAVKRPHAHFLGNRELVDLFLEEGRVAGLLRHPNVVPVFGVGEDVRGPYLLMDFVEGISLADLIKLTLRNGDLLPISLVVQVAIQAAEGLQAAHEFVSVEGVAMPLVHRDVTPQNILIGYDGVVRVVDFGIAKVLSAETPETTAVLRGKSGYMAPEQLRFLGVDARADLFSLGVTLFESLTCERLYAGGLDVAARKIINDPPPELSAYRGDCDPALERLLFELLVKDREHRIPSARVLAERLEVIATQLRKVGDWETLESFLSSELGQRRDTSRAELAEDVTNARRKSSRQARRGGFRVALMVGGVVAVLGTGMFALRGDTHDSDSAARVVNEAHGATLPTAGAENLTPEPGDETDRQSDLLPDPVDEPAVPQLSTDSSSMVPVEKAGEISRRSRGRRRPPFRRAQTGMARTSMMAAGRPNAAERNTAMRQGLEKELW